MSIVIFVVVDVDVVVVVVVYVTWLVSVEDEADALQHPVALVLGREQVRLEHQTHSHGVSSLRCRVHGRTERVLKT